MAAREFDWDSLSEREGQFMQQVVSELQGVSWIMPALDALAAKGGIKQQNKALLFELRFAHALHTRGLAATYEVPGEGDSTLDFELESGGKLWRFELMRLTETQAALQATVERRNEKGTVWSERFLSSDNVDKRQSPEGETLKAVQRICQKSERNGRPHKFPKPDGALHVLIVDFRTFLHGGDDADCIHVALGASCLPTELRLAWEGKIITGAFDPATETKGASETRGRVHFIGFLVEKEFGPGTMAAAIRLVANPKLLKTEDEAKAVLKTWPLPPPKVLNVRM